MKVGQLYAELRMDSKQFQSALTQASGAFGKFTALIKTGALIAAAAVVGIAGGSVKMAADFDAAMVRSLAIMEGVSAGQRAAMETAAREVAKTTTLSAETAANGIYNLASAGYDADNAMRLMPISARFAMAGELDLAKATDYLVNSQAALGLKVADVTQNEENMIRVSDVLTKVNMMSTGTIETFSAALTNKAANALRIVNKDLEEGAAILGVFAAQGIHGEEAGQALYMVLRDMQSANLRNKAAWEDHGVAVYDASGNMMHMADIMSGLETLTAGMSDEQKKMTLATLGFTDRSIAYIFSMMGMSSEIRRYDTALRDVTGYTERVAAKQLESFNARMTIMWHKVQDVGISIGQALLPAVGDMVSGIGDWVDANHDLIVSLVTGLMSVLGDIGNEIGKIAGVILPILITGFQYFATNILPMIQKGFSELQRHFQNAVKYAQPLIDLLVKHAEPVLIAIAVIITATVVPALLAMAAAWVAALAPVVAILALGAAIGILVGHFGLLDEAVAVAQKMFADFEMVLRTLGIVVDGVIKIIAGLLGALIDFADAAIRAINLDWDGAAAAAERGMARMGEAVDGTAQIFNAQGIAMEQKQAEVTETLRMEAIKRESELWGESERYGNWASLIVDAGETAADGTNAATTGMEIDFKGLARSLGITEEEARARFGGIGSAAEDAAGTTSEAVEKIMWTLDDLTGEMGDMYGSADDAWKKFKKSAKDGTEDVDARIQKLQSRLKSLDEEDLSKLGPSALANWGAARAATVQELGGLTSFVDNKGTIISDIFPAAMATMESQSTSQWQQLFTNAVGYMHQLEVQADNYGAATMRAYGQGISSQYGYVVGKTKQVMAGARGVLEAHSPPGPESPLHKIGDWAEATFMEWADRAAKVGPRLADKVMEGLGDVAVAVRGPMPALAVAGPSILPRDSGTDRRSRYDGRRDAPLIGEQHIHGLTEEEVTRGTKRAFRHEALNWNMEGR